MTKLTNHLKHCQENKRIFFNQFEGASTQFYHRNLAFYVMFMFIFFSVSKIGIFRENFEILRDNNEIYWHFLEKFRMSFRPFFRIFGSKALSALEAKVKLSRQNQKTIVIKNFCFVCCIRIKSFKAVKFHQRLICS